MSVIAYLEDHASGEPRVSVVDGIDCLDESSNCSRILQSVGTTNVDKILKDGPYRFTGFIWRCGRLI